VTLAGAAVVRVGHFVTIDRTADGVEDGYRRAGLIRGNDDPRGPLRHQGAYGVLTELTAGGDAWVRLRDDTNALVRVPSAALAPASAGRR
jgi:hypothetical protein